MRHHLALLAVLLLALPATGQFTPKRAGWEEHTVPAGLHVGSYASSLGARLASDGALDTGAGVLRLLDGESGAPLLLRGLDYGEGPALYAAFQGDIGDVALEGLCLADPVSAGGDTRLVAALQLKLEARGGESRSVRLAAALAPGGGDPTGRPAPSLPFAADVAFTEDDGVVLRDGRALLGTVGPRPLLELAPATDADGTVATLTWELEVAPGKPAFVELKLAGPPATPTVDEEGWRRAFRRSTYAFREEGLRWQWRYRGAFADMDVASREFWHSMVSGVFFLRSLGEAHGDITRLSDRPYGHPASDAAVEAEIIGILMEWGMESIATAHLRVLLDELGPRTQGLPPERRLAYLHGLARAVRLGNDPDHAFLLAAGILALVDQPLAVEPWHDPAEVRADLGVILEMAGAGDASQLPELLLDESDPRPVPTLWRQVRADLTAGRGAAAWAGMTRLFALGTPSGLGAVTPGADLDGTWSMAMLTLGRRFLIDDHGKDLVLVPGLAYGLFQVGRQLRTNALPTRYGIVRVSAFHTTPKVLGAWVLLQPTLTPERVLVGLPEGHRAVPETFIIDGGTAVEVDDGSRLAVTDDPEYPGGVRFTVRIRPER